MISIALLLSLGIAPLSQTSGPVVMARLTHPGATCIAISPDGSTLVTSGQDGVRLWDLDSARLLSTFDAHATIVPGQHVKSSHVTGMAFTHTGKKQLATAGKDGNIVFWNLDKKSPATVICEPWVVGNPEHVSSLRRLPIRCLCLGRDCVFGGTYSTATMWERDSGSRVTEFGWAVAKELLSLADLQEQVNHDGEPFPFADYFHFQGRLTQKPHYLLRWKASESDSRNIRAIKLIPPGERIALLRSHEIEIVTLQDGALEQTIPGTEFAVSPDGAHLAAGSRFQRCTVWNTATWTKEGTVPEVVLPAEYLHDGSLIARSARELDLCRKTDGDWQVSPLEVPSAGRVHSTAVSNNGKLFGAIWSGLTRNNVIVYNYGDIKAGQN